jgi:lipoprotein signal peptidase
MKHIIALIAMLSITTSVGLIISGIFTHDTSKIQSGAILLIAGTFVGNQFD